MSAREYTDATVTIDGVTLPMPRLMLAAPTSEEMLRARLPAAAVEARGGWAGGSHRVEFTIADSGDAFDAITRMIDEANREVSRAILGGGAPSEGGRWYAWGSRGCFHEGCDGTGSAEEGGSHWCTMGAT